MEAAAAHPDSLHDRAMGLVESSRFPRFMRTVSIALLLVAALVTAGLVFAVVALPRLARQTPDWWRQPLSPANRAEVAGALDNGAYTTMTQARDLKAGAKVGSTSVAVSEPWTVSIRAIDASAWLTERLPQWLANQRQPDTILADVGDIQVSFGGRGGGVIHAGLQFNDGRCLWTTLEPTVTATGLTVRAGDISVGRISLPAAAVLTHEPGTPPPLLKHAGGEGGGVELADALLAKRPLTTDASVRLPDGRRVRLLALEVRDDRLVLTCRTEMER